jgi:quinol monooxygenase YgiN
MSEASEDLVVVALIAAKPGSEDVVRGALEQLVAPTRDEAGCRSYDLYESATTAGTYVTVEAWGEQSDLDAHMASPHIAATFAAAGDHLASAPAIHVLKPITVG